MKTMRQLWLAAVLVMTVIASPCLSQDRESQEKNGETAKERTEEGVGLTIYSQSRETAAPGYYDNYGRWVQPTPGYAVVKEWRKIKLDNGIN